ncbi:DUF488 domain-containing protein [Leucobacter sp. NPDC077196]|uniref:DUF488 domain-containing protein n=1 Tax=Leucobacter sp. NPDC077196 TaxID=3154959 RepID=UPI00342A0627
MTEPIFTIGHSNRALDEFVSLLRESSVALVVDVRKLPGSKTYPWFNEDQLAPALRESGIDFHRAAGLTGRRRVSKDVPFDVNAWWKNRSFHNYADHALSEEFTLSLAEVLQRSRSHRLAVMCSEAVWWRCHRRIIADHLLARGEDVRHILSEGHVNAAELSAGAVLAESDQVRYPASSPERHQQ